MIKTAIVLVGGTGMRLRPITEDIPKVMVDVNGKPLLEWLILWLKEEGVKRIVLGVAYKKDAIIDFFGNGEKHGVNIHYSIHSVKDGTGTAFMKAIRNCNVQDEFFLCMNGDTITDISLRELATFHKNKKRSVTLVTVPLKSSFGVVKLDGNNITSFEEKPIIDGMWMSAGIYVFNRDTINFMDTGDIERTTFPELSEKGLLRSFKFTGLWKTINTPKELEELKTELED